MPGMTKTICPNQTRSTMKTTRPKTRPMVSLTQTPMPMMVRIVQIAAAVVLLAGVEAIRWRRDYRRWKTSWRQSQT